MVHGLKTDHPHNADERNLDDVHEIMNSSQDYHGSLVYHTLSDSVGHPSPGSGVGSLSPPQVRLDVGHLTPESEERCQSNTWKGRLEGN